MFEFLLGHLEIPVRIDHDAAAQVEIESEV